jgi:tetratricopeptide (TPR) repeat protein
MRYRLLTAAIVTVSLCAAIPGLAQQQPKADAGVTAQPIASTSAAAGDAGAPAPQATEDAAAPTLASPALTMHRVAPPPPPPTPEQIAALNRLQEEADAYAKGAKDYRDTVTTIIKLHYEEKKKTILSGLDKEIAIEKAELYKAREIAIKRLEEFIAKYPSEPEATPDAMYRLAALYEERARSDDATADLSIGLKPAIALYKRVIKEFPKYNHLAAIFYYLGHALNDSSRIEEAQQVWRSLVCHNKFPYPTQTDPKNSDVDAIIALPQDQPPDYWTGWRQRYQFPKQVSKGNPETNFVDPFPNDCEAIPQPTLRPGEDPKYVAEIWWQIGNWEFDQLDTRGGVVSDEPIAVWDLNRAASAYVHSLQFKKPPLYGVALYKYAWTLFKQQRYKGATQEFVKLLVHTDELEKEGDTNVGDFRSEAYTYIAGSLTNVDFDGPQPWEPFIQRPDIVDTEPNPDIAEKKLHVAIDRVKDPTLIPQDKPWTIEIYKSLAGEFRSLNQFNNAIEVYSLILQKWPMDPTAPDVQNEIALTYDQKLVTLKAGSPDHDTIAAKALQARTALANYIGNTPWVDANKDNPGAIQNAERLVKGGLRQAAATHTNLGKQYLVAASTAPSDKEKLDDLTRAASEYRLAALGWQGYLKQDENAPDAYDSRFWLADARDKMVRIKLILHTTKKDQFPEPTTQEIDDAKAAAIDVRDSNEDDKYLDVAATFVVEESDVARDLAYQLYDDTKGTQGIQKRTELEMVGTGDEARPKKVEIPAVVLASMKARDEYVQRVPPEKDSSHNALMYQFDVGDVYFVYGQFDQAKARFEPLYKEHCGKDEYGQKAWTKLITMAAKSNDTVRARQLAEADKAHSCAVGGSQGKVCTKKAECGPDEDCIDAHCKNTLTVDIFAAAGYQDADKKFVEACGRDLKSDSDRCDPVTPDRIKKWQEAGALYEAALNNAPSRREAPRGAMRAAFCFKQVGDSNRAIKNYERFISEYGKEDILSKLQGTDPKQYHERLKFLQQAYDEEGTTYYAFFSYPQAASIYEKVAKITRFETPKRKEAAKNAMILENAIGRRNEMLAMYRIVTSLGPTADEKANYDYLVASFDYQQWNPNGSDSGSNRQARFNAISALQTFYHSHKGNAAAAKYSLEAAWRVARMKKAGNDGSYHDWYKNTVAAWDFYHNVNSAEAAKLPFVDYGAEAAFIPLDEEIHQKFDYDSGHHKYVDLHAEDIMGKIDQKTGHFISEGKYRKDAKTADDYDQKLGAVAKKYNTSLEWLPAVLERRGSLYDSLRTGLYYCGGSAFKLFTKKQEATLKQMRNSGRDDLVDLADDIEAKVKKGWRDKRDQEIDGADTIMIRYYAQSAALQKAYNVRNAWTARAIARLASLTDLIGDPKMATYVNQTADLAHPGSRLTYTNGMYRQMRSGLPLALPANGVAAPLPVAP